LFLVKKGLALISETPDIRQKDQVAAQIQKKIRLIEMYLQAHACVKNDPKKSNDNRRENIEELDR
jgi:hypothetical protein